VSPFRSYQRLFRIAGPAYVAVAFVGRLPLAMSQLGILLLVASSTGSYAAGGASAGALALANAAGSPLAGGLADRWGQRPVVLVQSLLGAAGLASIVALSEADVTWPVLAAVAALTGCALPQVGPLARVRWRPMTHHSYGETDRRRLVDAAFSYEGAADEASFVLGPAIVGGAAALVNPGAALAAAAVLLAVFGSMFALHPTAALVARLGRHAADARGRLWSTALVILAGAQLLMGVVFGSVQTGTSVLARAAGDLGMAGVLQALLGVGSVIAGLAVAALPERFGLAWRLVVFATLLAGLTTPLLAVDSLGSLAVVLLVLGIVIAPYMITVFTLAERLVPIGRSSGAMTLLSGVTGLGYAVGSTVAGQLADAHGHRAAFAVAVVAGAAAAALAWSGLPILRRRESQTSAVTPHERIASNA
jgi:MFS family permease